VLLPTKVGTDSNLDPGHSSNAMPITFGAKRRLHYMVVEVTGIGQLEIKFRLHRLLLLFVV